MAYSLTVFLTATIVIVRGSVLESTSFDGARPHRPVRALLSDQFQSKLTPNTPSTESVQSVSSAVSSKWTDRMVPYTECRSRYAIEMGVFYNGAEVRSVNSDFDDSVDLHDGDSAEYLLRERFHDDDLSDSDGSSFSVEPVSSDGDRDGVRSHSEDDSLRYVGSEDDEFMEHQTEWNETVEPDHSEDAISSTGSMAVDEATRWSLEDDGSWSRSQSVFADPSTESVSRLDIPRKHFLIAAFVLTLNGLGIASYFVWCRMRRSREGMDSMDCAEDSDSDYIMESDLEMECGDVIDGEFITESDAEQCSY